MDRKINYLLIIFSFYFSQINLYSQGTWERTASPTDHRLRSVYFVDSLYGWAVGDSGTIIRTVDGGSNWVFQNSETENTIVNVFFLNRELGWASSWNTSTLPFGTILLKSTNGGQNWIGKAYRDDTILFIDSLIGWMVGKPHALVKTTNGGLSWEQADIDTSLFAFFPVLNITFFNSQYGYACGGAIDGAGVVWSTTNGGDNWFADPSDAPPDPINQVHTFDSLSVIGIGGDREIFGVGVIRTFDGGLFWEFEDINIPGVGFTLDFRNDYEAWSTLGVNLIYSLDAGATWTQISSPDSSDIGDIIFPDSLHGFAVGKQGVILKYNLPIVDDVSDYDDIVPKSFELYQNYPNPFNPSTAILFSVPVTSYITLKVYDVLGNEITTLINGQKEAGRYQVQFNAANLVSGIYIYRIVTGDFISSKKLILMK